MKNLILPNDVQWCSLCNSKQADGTVKVEDVTTGDIVDLPACLECVSKLDWSGTDKSVRPEGI